MLMTLEISAISLAALIIREFGSPRLGFSLAHYPTNRPTPTKFEPPPPIVKHPSSLGDWAKKAPFFGGSIIIAVYNTRAHVRACILYIYNTCKYVPSPEIIYPNPNHGDALK